VAPLLVIALAAVLVDVVRRPGFRRLAVRNVARRPREAALVVLGALLGTAILTASFVVGDTLTGSIKDQARTRLGEVDLVLRPDDPNQLMPAVAAVDSGSIEQVDGSLTIRRAQATAATIGEGRIAEPYAGVIELDFDAARSFGSDASLTGFADAGPTPTGTDVVVGDDVLDKLEVEVGDQIELHLYGTARTVTIRDRVPRLGLAGYGAYAFRSQAPTVFVAPGTIDALRAEGAERAATAEAPRAELLLSADGGVFDGELASHITYDTVKSRLEGVPGVFVDEVKHGDGGLVDDAEAEGEGVTQLFSAIGGFSVIAAILLLVNIIVMLAEERKSELGILRAIGLKRNHLVRTFAIEGAIYSVVAAAGGALLGIGIGRIVSTIASSISNSQSNAGTLEMRFTVVPGHVVTGFVMGVLISLVTVWLTSLRIARLNVIRAIRDIPEPPKPRRALRPVVLGVLGMALGGLVLASGIGGRAAAPTLIGMPLLLGSAIPLLRWWLSKRVAVSLPATVSLLWGIFVFKIVPGSFGEAGVELFVIQGVLLVGAAVTLLTANTDLLGHTADRLLSRRGGVAARLGVAYPLARTFRTGVLLGSFALVIFTMTFLASFQRMFGAQAPQLAAEAKGGYDLVVDSSTSNPIVAAELATHEGVSGVATLRRGFAEFDTWYSDDFIFWGLTGFDQAFVDGGVPELKHRPADMSDVEVFQQVLAGAPVQTPAGPAHPAIVGDYFVQEGQGPPSGRLRAGDTFQMRNPVTDEITTMVALGVVAGDWVFNGVLLGEPYVASELSQTVRNRHYVAVADDADASAVAASITGEFLLNGADAWTFLERTEDGLGTQRSFMNLMQGYLGLGLAIGIASLGVVMVRAVRERRRQIGMLRAMGFQSGVVRRAFLFECAFVAGQGILVGIGLGLITAWSVISNSTAFDDQPTPFNIPWAWVGILLVVPMIGALLATLAPATTASRVRPAVALRIAD
jgi:putative ABC transport system permease protein